MTHEGWRIKKDGSRFWGTVVITAIHSESGELIGFSKVTRDLTNKKQADDLLQSNAIELALKNKSLEILNEEISSFAYVASHDLQEPLRKIRTFTSRISEANDLTSTKVFASKIENSALRMQNLIQDLLVYSQVSSDPTVFGPVDLNEVLATVKEDLDHLLSEKKGRLLVDPLPVIHGVRFQAYQLFMNLISNSLKFAKADVAPQIKITTKLLRAGTFPQAMPTTGENTT